MRYVSAYVFMLVASPVIMFACMIGSTPAMGQSDNQTDEQFCLSLTDHGPANTAQARTLGDACFSAANTRRRVARGTSNSRVRQEHLVAAASDFITAAKARFLVGLRGTALAELAYAREALTEVLAKPANPGLRRKGRALLDYSESIRLTIEHP
jgi:hypothetical protein